MQYILSWLPTQENDKVYPMKDVIIITGGDKGYSKTDWKMDRDTIVERNERQGIKESDRMEAETIAMRA